MHIKHITISNFRSFRQQGEIQPFSSGTNTVVGRNGTGKSNLFDAVQFALLAPKFAHLRQEERQALLHEGSGAAAVNAFVEIVFDNSDHRFQHENSDEVVLRRTIGLKKDEFFLQRKRTTKTEIQSLLEGAGFSKSNPYFIVQQGKVQDLCTMSDTARLRLLKEVAGTTVYDEKKTESLAKMEDNKNSIAKITDMLANIEDRLAELNEEKEELTAYQQLDRSRRAAQYALYNLELKKARAQLDEIEEDRRNHLETLSELHETSKVTHDEIRNVEAVLKTKGTALRRVHKTVQGIEKDKKLAVQNFTKLDLECKELEENITSREEQAVNNRKLLGDLGKEIAQVEEQLKNQVQPVYDEAASALQKLRDEHSSCVKETEALYAKQGRGRRFRSIEERDEFLQANRRGLDESKKAKESEMRDHQDSLAHLRRTVEQESKEIESTKSTIAKETAAHQSFTKTLDEKKRERVALLDARRETWRSLEDVRDKTRDARENLQSCLSDLSKIMPRATAMGIRALRDIVDDMGLIRGEQYFGMLMENFELQHEKYRTAVEVAAQNSLFHVIVDTDTTAARLMKRLEDERLGRVTFLPLNQLRVENISYAEHNEIRPMLTTCLKYHKKVDRVMQHVFAKKLIARSKEVASEWSIKVSMDVITLEGQLCSRKGSLTGGYIDSNKSRLLAYSKQLAAQDKFEKLQVEYEKMDVAAKDDDAKLKSLMQEMQRLEAKKGQLDNRLSRQERDMERLEDRYKKHRDLTESLEKTTIPELERAIHSLSEDIGRIDDEIGTELKQTLSADERTRLAELKSQQDQLAREIEQSEEKVDTASHDKQKLESLLENNLYKRRLELTDGSAEETGGSSRLSSGNGRKSLAAEQARRRGELDERQQDLAQAQRLKEDLEAKLEETREVEAEIRKDINEAKTQLEQLRGQDAKNGKAWDEAKDKSDRLLSKRATFTAKRENNTRKIQELGSLPPPAELKKYSNKSPSQLEKALDQVNNKIQKYAHVNKKAYDQYVNFSESRERLLKRKEELDDGAEKVQELIDSLDQQKDEAINRTFRGVSSHFKDVFKELVPDGAGELIMRTAMDADVKEDQDEDEVASEAPGSKADGKGTLDVSLFRGVGIKVRFTAIGENYMMSQLSGGQKALVALGLIFAIQRCDPAPFYLFDELDQALDSTYRAAVANVIHRQANDEENPTQFIVSTFRQELVTIANRCFGISYQNKVSSFHAMNKKDAQGFIANLMSSEEAVGEVTSVAASKASRLTRGSRKSGTTEKDEEDSKETPRASRKRKAVGDDESSGEYSNHENMLSPEASM